MRIRQPERENAALLLDRIYQHYREKQPATPTAVLTPIVSPDRESIANAAGMTLMQVREEVSDTVRLLQQHGDSHLYGYSGLDLLGHADAELLPDGVDPSGEGYMVMADRIRRLIAEPLMVCCRGTGSAAGRSKASIAEVGPIP
nr:SGNH/GDSL hydrolase family protein [Paenibacillus hemerocallicola]